MSKLTDFLRWTPTPPSPPTSSLATIHRASTSPIELREANAALHVTHTVGKPQWPKYDYETFDRQAYQRISLIFRCVNLMASSVAEAPVRVYAENDGQQQTIVDHPLRQLITHPNPQMGEGQLWYSMMVRMAIFGFGLLEIERGSYGRPVGLWPLRSEWARPIPRDNDAYDWEYTVPGRPPVVIEGNDLCVIPFAPSAGGDPRGVGPLEVALREWALLSTLQDHLKGFFDGGGLPVYGLIPDDEAMLTQDQANVLREQWVEATTWRHGLPPKPPIMQSIKGIERLSFDFNELAYTDLRDVSEIAILQAFGIPGSMVGQRYAQERNTFSNYGEARKSFYQDTVQKLWARIDDALTRSLLPEFETSSLINLEFDTSRIDALQEDQAEVRTHMLAALQAGGVTRADYRRAAGLPVEPSDEVYLMPFSVIEVPVGQAMPPRAIAAPPADDEADDDPDERQRLMRHEQRGAALQQRSLRVYTRLGERFAPLVDTFLSGQLQRILGTFDARSGDGPPETRAIEYLAGIDWPAEDDALTEVMVRVFDGAGQQAAIGVAAETGLPAPVDIWDIANPQLGNVKNLIGQRVTGINETTKGDIQRIVDTALNEGVSGQELSDRLKGLYEETYKSRSMTIARTESMTAYNHASAANYQAMGFTKVELRDNPAHTDDPGSDGLTCAQRHGLVVPIESVGRHIAAEHPNGSLSMRAVDDIYEW